MSIYTCKGRLSYEDCLILSSKGTRIKGGVKDLVYIPRRFGFHDFNITSKS